MGNGLTAGNVLLLERQRVILQFVPALRPQCSFQFRSQIGVIVGERNEDTHRGTPALAEGILALDFPSNDAARIEELNVRANEGQLTEDERAELEAYVNVGDLLAYWQSKARQAIQSHA